MCSPCSLISDVLFSITHGLEVPKGILKMAPLHTIENRGATSEKNPATLTYNKRHYKNVRHQATRRAQIWLNKWPHLDAIQVLFISIANEDPVFISVATEDPVNKNVSLAVTVRAHACIEGQRERMLFRMSRSVISLFFCHVN